MFRPRNRPALASDYPYSYVDGQQVIYFNLDHVKLLKKAKKFGLTPLTLLTWKSDQKNPSPLKQVPVKSHRSDKFCIEILVRDDFSKAHCDAAYALMKFYHLQPLEAIAALNGTAPTEAILVGKYYQHGMTGETFNKNSETSVYCSTEMEFVDLISYLIDHEHLSLRTALDEAAHLKQKELYLLKCFYADGLRASHIIALRDDKHKAFNHFSFIHPDDDRNQIIPLMRKVFCYEVEHGMPIQEAIELALTKAQNVESLKTVNAMVDEDHRRRDQAAARAEAMLKPIFNNKLSEDTYHALIRKAGLSKADAIATVRKFEDDLPRMRILKEYCDVGVTGEELKGFPFSLEEVKQVRQFSKYTPRFVIYEMHDLTPIQLTYFLQLHDLGVSIGDVKSIKFETPCRPGIREMAALYIKKYGFTEYALKQVANKSDFELAEMLKGMSGNKPAVVKG